MKKIDYLTGSCRYCRFYDTEGHRGGNCELFNVLVQANWQACSQIQDPFGDHEKFENFNKNPIAVNTTQRPQPARQTLRV
jgi:hypothetical protein